jgi:hypothetical protein
MSGVAGCFEKFLEMVLRRPCLVLKVTLDGRNALLTMVVAGCHGDAARAPLQPLLVTLGALPSVLSGGLRWHCLERRQPQPPPR